MSMSGLRRPHYAALAVAATIGIALLAYHNYQQAQVKPTGSGLHRSNALRRSPRRRRTRSSEQQSGPPYVDETVNLHILSIVNSNRVVGQYQNNTLLPHVVDLDLVDLSLRHTNITDLLGNLTTRTQDWPDGWSAVSHRSLLDHIEGQYVYYIVKELCQSGFEVTHYRFKALVSAFEQLGFSTKAAHKGIKSAVSGEDVDSHWSPEPSSTASQVEQIDGAGDVSDTHPPPSNHEEDQDDEATRFPPSEFEDSGASPNMLSILYSISGEQARRNGYIHRGIECNSCGALPIQGIRYHCANCFDYDLCETCEAHQVHHKNHVFYKIRIPAPHRGPIKQVHPKWYPGSPNRFPENLLRHVSDRLKDQYGMDITEIDALYDQFKCMAGAHFSNDPCELDIAIDRKAFDLYFSPGSSDKPSPSNLIHDRVFSFYDRNDDGLIGFEEFLAGLAALLNKSRMARLSRIFLAYDLDADGYVCRKDFLRIFRAHYDHIRQQNREMLANQEELGYLDEEIREVVPGSQPLSAAFGGGDFHAHQSRAGMDKQASANGDLLITSGPNEVLQHDQELQGDRARAIGNAAVGKRPGPHPFRSFRTQTPQDEPLLRLPIRGGIEVVGIHHADDATEDDLSGPDPPLQTYGWPPLLTPQPEDIISALGVEVAVEDINDPLDRSRVIYAQSQRLDSNLDHFLDWTRKRAVHDRWKRRQFYLDEEEGMTKPEGYTEPDSSDEESNEPETKTASSSRRQSLRSRSSSKVRFDDSAIDTDYDTRSNASSRSVPQNERWGGYELSSPEIDVGQDVLYEAVQEGINELLDKLFKEKEDAAVAAKGSRKAREQWRDLFEQHKKAVLEEVEVTEKLLIDADMLRTEELLKGPQSAPGSPEVPTHRAPSEHSGDGEAALSELPPDLNALVQRRFGSQIEVGIAEALNELKLASALAEAEKAPASSNQADLDPTLPQNMPNEWEPVRNSSLKTGPRPTKQTLNEWLLHETTEVESEARGGPGKLTFEEFRWKMRRQDKSQNGIGASNGAEEHGYWEESADLGELSFLGTWLEMASF